MSEFNKSYRIRTEIGKDTQLFVKLDNNYDILELMSMKINQENVYRFHSANYGVVAGRVLANEAFGIPNAKISVFISRDETNTVDDIIKEVLYPYNNTSTKDDDGIRYNLLPNEQVSNCHTIIGTFPEKQYMLDNDNILEVFDSYFKFTTRTNNAGDYMIFGIPTGNQTIHVDIDLSDIGILSQKPRDMVYKGYNIEQFENPNKFKHDTNLSSLTQVISQDNITNVIPFWGNEEEDTVGITRCDINVQYKFEPTCIFMGSVVSDTHSNGISQKCIPTPGMGAMDEITTGSGTIEMIRKTYSGDVEEFQVQGTQLINGDGVWCYQIPMNLDYMMTDEYGNMVPTNNPNKGIPTRTKVRFRLSLQDMETDSSNIHRCKVLVPHNPNVYSNTCENELDYQFGTNTKEDSYRDLYWNGVYSVKSYIPRIQKGSNWKNDKFTGFKRVNYYGDNNPIPYNNIRIRLPFAYTMLCVLIKISIKLSSFLNWTFKLCGASFVGIDYEEGGKATGSFVSINGEICNENLEYLCIIPGIDVRKVASEPTSKKASMLGGTILKHYEDVGGTVDIEKYMDSSVSDKDSESIDYYNSDYVSNNIKTSYGENTELKSDYEFNVASTDDKKKEKSDTIINVEIRGIRVTDKIDYFIQCIELKLAQEMKVIQFDFYNDWINGLIYIPRWVRNINKKKTFSWGATNYEGKVSACNENYHGGNRNLVQQCSLSYNLNTNTVTNEIGCNKRKLTCHKDTSVRKAFSILKSSGIIKTVETLKKQYVYYLKPYEQADNKNVRLFATDIILLGTLNDCDKWGIPNALTELQSTSYQMPPNLALTDSDLEGNEYVSNKDMDRYIGMKVNIDEMTTSNIVNLDGKESNPKNCYIGINPLEEDANYTEMSGIDWGYTGPLQAVPNSPNIYDRITGEERDRFKFYRPGGHFLGLSCRNSETSIKSCVNLSRICEHGVWMSQRQVLNVPNPEFDNLSDEEKTYSNAFLDYATVPSGFISKDEISGTNYRRLFASMNKNRLRTTIDEKTGYPIYDFEYVNPTNFSGDLSNYVFDNTIGVDMNRQITNGVTEHYYEYIDDNYLNRSGTVIRRTVKEAQIMRTGEYKDDEYIKYRFGYNDESINERSEIKKRFLEYKRITDRNTNSIIETVSFPVYDNSFYFYFGLHDGKTALDEFKKTYYAVCEKTNNLIDIDNKVNFINTKEILDGVCSSKPTGEFIFSIDANSHVYGEKGLSIRVKNETYFEYPNNEVSIDSLEKGYLKGCLSYQEIGGKEWISIPQSSNVLTIKGPVNAIKISSLRAGKYVIEVESIEGIFTVLNFVIKRDNISGSLLYGDFATNRTTLNEKYDSNSDDSVRDKDKGGYIAFDGNLVEYTGSNDEENGVTEIPLFNKGNDDISECINCICIEFTMSKEQYKLTNNSNEPKIFTLYNITQEKEIGSVTIKESEGYYKIPAPYANIEYTVYVETKMNDCKISSSEFASELYKWKIGTVYISCAPPLYVTYNDINFNLLMKYNTLVVTEDEKIEYYGDIKSKYGWWCNPLLYSSESESTCWKVKNNLFFDNDKPHKVRININGGTPPYTESLRGGTLIGDTTIPSEPSLGYNNVIFPTINEGLPEDDRYNFGLYVTDRYGLRMPQSEFVNNEFIFPVIYKPFFTQTMIMLIDRADDENVFCTYGHVYNGKTFKISTGFNDVTINNVSLNNSITTQKEDYILEINELDLSDIKGGYRYNGPYNKYNARKSVFNARIDEYNVGLNNDSDMSYVKLKIGSEQVHNNASYTDYTHISRNDIMFDKFNITYDNDGFNVSLVTNEKEDEYKIFYVIYDTYDNEKTVANLGYKGDIRYPYSTNSKKIDVRLGNLLLRKIINIYENEDDYKKFFPENTSDKKKIYNLGNDYGFVENNKIDEVNGKIKYSIGDVEKDNDYDWRIYFIAIPTKILDKKTTKEGIEDSSNKHNMLIPLTVSRAIDINQLDRFYPLNFYGLELKYVIDKNGGESLTLTVKYPNSTQKNYKLARQKLTFHFYRLNQVNNKYVPICDISVTMPDDLSGTKGKTSKSLSTTEYLPILLPNYDYKTSQSIDYNYNAGLYYTFDAEKDGFQSPSTFTDENGAYFSPEVIIENSYNA